MDNPYKPCKGSRTIGDVITGLGYNINDIIFDNAALPEESGPPSYNNYAELDEVGEVARDKFDMLRKLGIQAAAASGMGSSQAQIIDG